MATIYAAPPEGEALVAAHGGGEEWLTDEPPTFLCATHEILDGATRGLGRTRAPAKNSLRRLSSSVTLSAAAALTRAGAGTPPSSLHRAPWLLLREKGEGGEGKVSRPALLFGRNQRNAVDGDWTDEIITAPKWAAGVWNLQAIFSTSTVEILAKILFFRERTQKFYWNMEEQTHP